MAGRGRGEGAAIQRLEGDSPPGSSSGDGSHRASGSTSEPSGEMVVRGRGGYRGDSLNTRPDMPVSRQRITDATIEKTSRKVQVLANFVKMEALDKRDMYKYRVEFEPQIESSALRRSYFMQAYRAEFGDHVSFDGMFEARSSTKLAEASKTVEFEDPVSKGNKIKITVKSTGSIQFSAFEMLRLYNINMKRILGALGFANLGIRTGFLHTDLTINIGDSGEINMIRGFQTSAGVHMDNQVLMNLEPVHKIMQKNNLLQLFVREQRQPGDLRENIRAKYVGKLVITVYNKRVYKIENVDFTLDPMKTFLDKKTNAQVSYTDYFKLRHGLEVKDKKQPLIIATPNRKRRDVADDAVEEVIHLIPEFCNLAGLTEEQRNNNRLKVDLIRASQISPNDRVKHIREFLNDMHGNEYCKTLLRSWGYKYERDMVSCPARVLGLESICAGSMVGKPFTSWPKTDPSAGFENVITKDCMAKTVPLKKLAIIIPKRLNREEQAVLTTLKRGFDRIKLVGQDIKVIRPDNDSSAGYLSALRSLPNDVTCTVVVLPGQNAEKYNAVKKFASCERGMITQVVTSRLLTDQRKAGGAAVKIAIQVGAKIGGEPWHLNIPLKDAMVCGYDTYKDTAQRGRSYGAFVATMNDKFSKYYSKADRHDKLDELSAHLAENMSAALKKWKEANGKFPLRIIIYRDGVSDGEIEHVFSNEVQQIRAALADVETQTQLMFCIVNKRIGARFFMKGAGDRNDSFMNCPPGTVIDNLVTKPNRYDFFLISQSTRAGTLTPTYYNIIHDSTALQAAHHQALAYKMTLAYYNWTGSVRVPAPCQYAHKLALLCGEHLHNIPSANLDDYLHYL